ncbi:MAG: tetratricopeptide repeat protein [Parachlamydia sp.]|jgi:tetratricopeptide (TPR) repeat protein|nr:tetratricopeptide repeat protein [Parachlamydia sp.]
MKIVPLCGLALLLASCQLSQETMEPVIPSIPLNHSIQSLPSAFDPLSPDERLEQWGRELLIGDAFARELDLYRAITCYKRALVLAPDNAIERRLQLDYNLIYAYYLGAKYQEAVNIFETSELAHVTPLFPAFSNLLILLYECYKQIGQDEKADCLLQTIQKYSPDTADDLTLFWDIKKGNMGNAEHKIKLHRSADALKADFTPYTQFAKSPQKARLLNALLPGAGYSYVGQTKSAVTSFMINALFTFASYQFFQRGYPAAGALTASMEMGWYLGGINGAGIEADEFNNRLYEGVAKKTLAEHGLYPVLMFETSF